MTPREADTHRLALTGSESRAGVLAEICLEASPKYARELLAHWFNLCDALAPSHEPLRAACERAGYFSDTAERPPMPCTVYRAAWEDDDIEGALSWTLDYAAAEKFCKYLTSPRAWWLGMKREDATAMIFRGTCTRAYGYLTSRDEAEVIAARVERIVPIAHLVSVPA